jgi:hypothetical protein
MAWSKKNRNFGFKSWLFLLSCLVLLSVPCLVLANVCPPFFLRSGEGEVINPRTDKNASKAYSTRKTCGACHDYELISKGYHFQQGWDRIRDDFSPEKPWVLSDGMMGKH